MLATAASEGPMVRIVRSASQAGTQGVAEDRHWLASQGFSAETLPKRATWYRPDGLALPNSPTDPYHRALYRGKGWTLKPPNIKGQPGAMPTNAGKVRVPRLARAVLQVMSGTDSWQGTATELMALLDPYAPPSGRPYRVTGMPLNPARLSKEIMGVKVTAALEASGVMVTRGFRGHERVLRLSCR